MVYEFIKDGSIEYPVETLCKTLSVSRSAYYAYVKGATYQLKSEKVILADRIRDEFATHRKRYGSRRISKSLQNQGISIGRYAIRSHMRVQGLHAIQPRSFVPKTTNSRHKLGYATNLLAEQAFPLAPDQVYVGDITYLPTTDGKWLYLNQWMDLYSRRIVGWKIDIHMGESLVTESLKQALNNRSPAPGLIVHSDRGGQYRSANFKNLMNGYQCLQSMSGADNPYDNAHAESFFSRFKAEMLPKNGFKSLEDAKKQTFEYIEMYYNTTRLHSGLKYFSPAGFEKCYYLNQCKTINLQTPNKTVLNEGMESILRFE